MIKWHLEGALPENLPKAYDHKEEGWTLVVIGANGGVSKYTSACPYVEEFEPPIAFGAGADYAMGAMLAGADAQRAVEIVCSLCNHSGGTIQVIDIFSALKEAAE